MFPRSVRRQTKLNFKFLYMAAFLFGGSSLLDTAVYSVLGGETNVLLFLYKKNLPQKCEITFLWQVFY